MKARVLTSVLLAAMLLSGCSDPPPVPQSTTAALAEETTAPAQISAGRQGVLTDAQRAAYNAAGQVSTALEDAEAARRKQLEEAQ